MAKAKKKAKKKAKARRKAPARKRAGAAKKKSAASRAPRVVPKDSAWRKLVETAIEHPDPAAQAGAARRAPAKKKAARK